MTLDAREFRDAMGCFTTGITVITARSQEGENVGCTANSFSSVSLDPPLVLWAIAKNANCYDAFIEAKNFAVHVLHSGQEDMSRLFATKDIDKFSEIKWSQGQDGTPLLNDYSVRFECTTENIFEGGDHMIIVGRVFNMDNPDAEPLGFYQGKYAKIVT